MCVFASFVYVPFFYFFFTSFPYITIKLKAVSIAAIEFTNISKTFVSFKAIHVINFTRRQKLSIVSYKRCLYRDGDNSLARPRRKQARKHIRDARDFNNIETRAVINFFSYKARRRMKFVQL